MRRFISMLAVVGTTLVLACGAALAATIVGTDKGETLTGTRLADFIRADGGADVVKGLGGPDQLSGDGGSDKVSGGPGRDRLFGSNGNDRLFSEDIFSQSGAFRDVVDCGPGQDFASVDFRDRVKDNCEEVAVAIP